MSSTFSPHHNYLGSNLSYLSNSSIQQKTKDSFIAQLEHEVFGELK